MRPTRGQGTHSDRAIQVHWDRTSFTIPLRYQAQFHRIYALHLAAVGAGLGVAGLAAWRISLGLAAGGELSSALWLLTHGPELLTAQPRGLGLMVLILLVTIPGLLCFLWAWLRRFQRGG